MAKLTKEKVTSCLKGSALTLATLAGVIGGVIFGQFNNYFLKVVLLGYTNLKKF